MKLKIATVLKCGGEYVERHVHALRDQCKKHVPWADFICLSDGHPECKTIPLVYDYPGWWSKMELFKLHGPILYMDLDTVVTGSCDHWLHQIENERFVILRNISRDPKDPNPAFGSGIMYWSGDMSWMLDKYKEQGCPEQLGGGDQKFMENNFEGDFSYFQDFTDDVVSFKRMIRTNKFPLYKTSIVYFHGNPRPWQQDIVTWP